MREYPKRGGDCEYTMDCPWGVDGWCDRPSGNKCEIQKMAEGCHYRILDKGATK